MKELNLEKLVRKNILELKPYSSARNEFMGEASVFLDANENSYGSPLPDNFNRYPDPLQWELKSELSKIKGVPPENIFIGNGSDEAIDLAFRIFCNPGLDNVIICPPTYGMYEVCANINNVHLKLIPLKDDFQLDVKGIKNTIDDHTKIIFICSPNNPTGNSMKMMDIKYILNSFEGMVIVDEAYINFAGQRSFISELTGYANLMVIQTFSKAWGLAALRLGIGFASGDVIDLFNKVKPPYNINEASQLLALDALHEHFQVNKWIREIVDERVKLAKSLTAFSFVEKVFPSDANFLLIKVENADELYNFLMENKMIVRNRSKEILCENCLRITVGTPSENTLLIETLNQFNS
jgi:histidinol-phosphate aminotransferase